jgi:hypothetical protein
VTRLEHLFRSPRGSLIAKDKHQCWGDKTRPQKAWAGLKELSLCQVDDKNSQHHSRIDFRALQPPPFVVKLCAGSFALLRMLLQTQSRTTLPEPEGCDKQMRICSLSCTPQSEQRRHVRACIANHGSNSLLTRDCDAPSGRRGCVDESYSSVGQDIACIPVVCTGSVVAIAPMKGSWSGNTAVFFLQLMCLQFFLLSVGFCSTSLVLETTVDRPFAPLQEVDAVLV